MEVSHASRLVSPSQNSPHQRPEERREKPNTRLLFDSAISVEGAGLCPILTLNEASTRPAETHVWNSGEEMAFRVCMLLSHYCQVGDEMLQMCMYTSHLPMSRLPQGSLSE
jgi:hypothetical protein